MTDHEKIQVFCDILDIDTDGINPDTKLSDISAWDSLSAVMVSTYIYEHLHRKVPGADLRNYVVVREILNNLE